MNKLFSTKKVGEQTEGIFYFISNNNWDYFSDVKASFSLQHEENNIYIRFKVNESNSKAVYTNFNEPVYEDSCVEFFISFDHKYYYNLEFNCIGNILGGYGANKQNRDWLKEDELKKIKTTPSLGFNKIEIIKHPIEWSLEAIIPKEIFSFDKIASFNGVKAKGNFYKCGDKQVQPHYLSWNPIKSECPNFHLPEYFGEIEFE